MPVIVAAVLLAVIAGLYLQHLGREMKDQGARLSLLLESRMDGLRESVDSKLDKNLGQSLERLYGQLGQIHSLASNVESLNRVITNVKTRGTWGEMQLGNALEQLFSPTQYRCNVKTRPNTGENVEFALIIPADEGETLLPIDSKFPVADYERLIDSAAAGNKEETDRLAKDLERKIRDFAKDVSEKYINPPVTTDFALIYLPLEGLYAEVAKMPGLIADLQLRRRVTVAGPTTLTALLSAFNMAFRNVALRKNVGEAFKIMQDIRREFSLHDESLNKLRAKLADCSGVVNDVQTRTNVMLRKLKAV